MSPQLKTLLADDLRNTFDQCHVANLEYLRDPRRDRRGTGRSGLRHRVRARRRVPGRDPHGPARMRRWPTLRVRRTVRAVPGRSHGDRGRDAGAMALQLKLRTDYWNGELRESTAPAAAGVLGYAGTDRSLTFDREKVIDVLATADRTAPPTPGGPGGGRMSSRPGPLSSATRRSPVRCRTTPPRQAFDEQLRRDFVRQHETELFTALGFAETATGRGPQDLRGRGGGGDPHRAAGRNAGPRTARGRLQAADHTPADASTRQPPSRSPTPTVSRPAAPPAPWPTTCTASSAPRRGRCQGRRQAARLEPGTTGEGAESKTITTRIDKARKPFRGKGAADDLARRQVAAATSGQAPLRPGQAGGQTRRPTHVRTSRTTGTPPRPRRPRVAHRVARRTRNPFALPIRSQG